MSNNLTAKAYYVFMFMLPLLFYSGIADTVLLPRQLFLSVFALLLTITVWKTIKKNNDSPKIDSANLAMVIYLLLAALISFVNAIVLSEALYVLSKLWIVFSFSILTGLLLKNNVITNRQIITSVIIFGCAAIGTIMIDISGKMLHGDGHLLRGVNLISGGFANKNLLSSILFLCLPFFLIGTREKRAVKITSFLAFALALFILVILRTRIVLIATFIFVGIIMFFYLKDYLKRKLWWLAGGLSSIAALLFLALKYGVFDKAKFSYDTTKYFSRLINNETLVERIKFWQNSWAMFKEYPFGVGLGNWQIYFPKYGLDKFNTFEIINGTHTLQRPHNDFLWSLCETGFIGFAVYAGVFGILIYQSFTLIKTAADKKERWMFINLFSGIIGFVLISFFDFPMERIEHLVILILLFSLVIHQYRIKNKSSFDFPVKKMFLLLFLVSGVCFSFTVAYSRFSSEKQVLKMEAARKDGYDQEVLSFAERGEDVFYKIDSKTIPLQWYQGVAKFSKQEYAESEICFEKAYALTPYNIHVMNNLASCYEVNGKRKEAVTMYLKALQISPHFNEARLNLAAVYFNSKAFDKAFHTIDSCSVESKDPKYKIFLPPILKAKVNLVMSGVNFPVITETKDSLINLQDYSQLYYESKKNNVTFEKQIINYLKN